MILKKITFLVILSIAIYSCASTNKQVKQTPEPNSDQESRAKDYYLSGALYDFQEQYEKALLEFYQALLYDSTSSQILKAIGRDLIRTHRFESARQYLLRALKYNPRDKENLYFIAEANFNLKDYQNSATYFERLWELDPYNGSVERNLIYIYSYLGEKNKLIDFYKRMIDVHGYDEETVAQLYSLYLKSEQMEQARAFVNNLIQQRPNDSQSWLLSGNFNATVEDTAEAIAAYQKALEIDPDNGEALIELYQLLRSGNDWEKLTEIFRQVVQKSPDNSEARLILAEGLYVTKQYEESQKVLQPLLEREEHQVHVYRLLGLIASEQSHFDQAEGFFKDIIKIDPKNKFGWLSLAFLYNQQQHFNKTITTLQDALSHLPEDKDLLAIYGSTLNQLQRYEEAMTVLQKAYQMDPDDLNIIVSLGVAYEELNMFPESDSLHETAIQKYPEEALLLNNYAYSLGERGIQLERALEMAKKAISIEPDNGAYLDTIGWIYYQLGDYEKAKQYILDAVSKREDSSVVIEHLGDVYFKLGNIEKAKEYWKQALQKDPGNEELRQKISNNEI